MENQVLRQLKLKSDALKRLAKERAYYAKEIEKDRAQVHKFKEEQKEYESKKAAEVLEESIAAKQAVDQKFNSYYEELKTMLQETESEYHDHEEVEAARKALQQSGLNGLNSIGRLE